MKFINKSKLLLCLVVMLAIVCLASCAAQTAGVVAPPPGSDSPVATSTGTMSGSTDSTPTVPASTTGVINNTTMPTNSTAMTNSTAPVNSTEPGNTTAATEPTYYFMTLDNFEEVETDYRHSSSLFRHTASKDAGSGLYQPPVTATLPRSIEINGNVFQLEQYAYVRVGTNVTFKLKGSSIASVTFDAVTGEILGLVNSSRNEFPFHTTTQEERQKSYLERALAAVRQYLPQVDIENFEVEYNFETDTSNSFGVGTGSGSIEFRRYIGGYATNEGVVVSFLEGELKSIHSAGIGHFKNFDPNLLQFDQAQHESAIASFLDYVRNGQEINEPKRQSTWIVRTADGRYAIQYTNEISLKADDSIHDTSEVRIYLE